MTFETACQAVDFLQKDNVSLKQHTVAFVGGEPLLCFELIKKIVRKAQESGIRKFILCTNGTLLDEEKVRFLVENNISPTIHVLSLSQILQNLDLFEPYRNFWINKIDPDPFRVRLCVTPGTVQSLAGDIEGILRHPMGGVLEFGVMPAMHETYQGDAHQSRKFLADLEREMIKIADIYSDRFNRMRPFNFSIGECLSYTAFSAFPDPAKAEFQFCSAGARMLSVGLEGELYPCYLCAANAQKSKEFVIGHVREGVVSPEPIGRFCGAKDNKCFSCLYWNRFENKDPDVPAKAYKMFYCCWLEGQKYIVEHIRWGRKEDIESVKKYIFFKNQFHVEVDKRLMLFEELLRESHFFHIEPSQKISGQELNPCRFNVWYWGKPFQKEKGLSQIVSFFESINSLEDVQLDMAFLKRILEADVDFQKIRNVCVGTDFRAANSESRVKLWFYSDQDPQMRDRVLEMANSPASFRNLLLGERFLWGCDFFLDGRSRLKMYAVFHEELLSQPKIQAQLKKLFHGEIVRHIENCSDFYVSVDKNWERILHFFPKDIAMLRKKMNAQEADLLSFDNVQKHYPALGFSFPEKEFLSGEIKTVNLYY